ncbi:hypothetical protein OESDEN_05952, partial [Oesophagostomum dentatum]
LTTNKKTSFSVLYEAVKSIYSVVQLTVFDVNYPYLFDLLLTVILAPTMFFNILLFIYGLKMVTHKRKKGFVIFVFGFHFIVVVPYFISGIYLYISANVSGATKLNKEVNDIFKESQEVLSAKTERLSSVVNYAASEVSFNDRSLCYKRKCKEAKLVMQVYLSTCSVYTL